MKILFLGRKHIAKSEDIIAALKRLDHQVDFVLFPNFHYSQEKDSYETSFGSQSCNIARSRKRYYARHFFSILFLLTSHFRKNRYDTLLAVDWFEGVILSLYKFLFARQAKLIFYSYDFYFFDTVFSSRYIINRIDAWVVRHADEVWNVNDALRMERERQGTFAQKNKTVPLGITEKVQAWTPKDTKHFLFVGNLKAGHNLTQLVEVFAALAKKDTQFQLTLVGRGNEEKKIQTLIQSEKMEKNIHLRGFVAEPELLTEIQAGKYTYGVALYEDTREVACVDPGKIKDYLSWNLPVLTTSANAIAGDVTKHQLGRVVVADDISVLVDIFLDITRDDIGEKQKHIHQYVTEHSFDLTLKQALV